MYRTVQVCRCGCGKKRAIKTENPVLSPKFHHAEITGQVALTVTPEEMTLEALAEPAVRAAMGKAIEEDTSWWRLKCANLEARMQAVERELAMTAWQRLRRFLHV